jgi:hypothetical protein
MADRPNDSYKSPYPDDYPDLMSPQETEFLFATPTRCSDTGSFKTARTHLTTKRSEDLSDLPWPVAPQPYDYQSYPMSPQEPLIRHQTDPLLIAASTGIYEEVKPRVSPVKAIHTFYKVFCHHRAIARMLMNDK